MTDAIDQINLKILEILEKDARANLNKIASECVLSSSAVLSRINKLKKNGTIIGFSLLVKQGTFGYSYGATVGITTEVPKTHVAAEEIRKQRNVIVCTKSIGRFNMCCFVIAKNMEELDRVTQKIKSVSGVKGIAVNIVLNSYWKDDKLENTITVNEAPDEIEMAIIKELMVNSRIPFLKIGKKLNLSHETVRKKFDGLKAKGIIIKCSAIVDYSKLGYQGTVFIFLSLIKGSNKAIVIQELKKYSYFYRINSVMGTFDIVAYARFRSLRDFTKMMDDMQQIPSVEQLDMCLANFTYFAYTPMPSTPFECDTIELS
jgi:Lrp/AsnC family transcriptional regulator, leucine-responsive regulatory protein